MDDKDEPVDLEILKALEEEGEQVFKTTPKTTKN